MSKRDLTVNACIPSNAVTAHAFPHEGIPPGQLVGATKPLAEDLLPPFSGLRLRCATGSGEQSLVSVFGTYVEAERGIERLLGSGCDVRTLSVVARDYLADECITGSDCSNERRQYWGALSGFWSRISGLLAGSASIDLSVVGPVLVAGPWAIALASLNERRALDVGKSRQEDMTALGLALHNLGVPEQRIASYETAVTDGWYLLSVQGACELR